MHDQLAAVRRLPPEAVQGLRQAFAEELAERLPRLRAATETRDDAQLLQALRDAHALGSSAAVVGEAEASSAARRAEALLAARPDGSQTPPGLAAAVAALTDSLAGWRP